MPTSGSNLHYLFVCLGNICRSPLAEGVFRHHVQAAGLEGRVDVDSAGTGAWHVGQPPDPRMVHTARRHGISLEGQRARQFMPADLDRFDRIYVMDKQNLRAVKRMARGEAQEEKIALFRSEDPYPGSGEVPDPYYGGERGFEEVFEIVDRTARAMVAALSAPNSG